MCLSDMSSSELLLLANNIALASSKNLDAEETPLLAAFLTSVADKLAITAIKNPSLYKKSGRLLLRTFQKIIL